MKASIKITILYYEITKFDKGVQAMLIIKFKHGNSN